MDEIKTMFSAIMDRLDSQGAQIEKLTNKVDHIQGDIVELKQGQDRQERILETLALRSIEQETELRDLKRIK